MARTQHRSNAVRTALLICGILAPVLYAVTDLLGGMRYEGYSFSSQMVSELMAKGAPSEAFVDPLFMTFNVLLLAFGIGVMREGAAWSPALRIVGVLLCIHAIAGFTGPTLYEMSPRGTGGVGSDVPHIVLTAFIVVCLLVAIGVGAFAFGKRFSTYSFATLAVVLIFGALTGYGGRLLAAGEPTPGFGLLERVCIYASQLWIAVLAATLLASRRPTIAPIDALATHTS